MKRPVLFAAIGLLLSLTFNAPPSARAEHPTHAQIDVHLGTFWIPGVESYAGYPPPVYGIPPRTVIVLSPVFTVDGLRIKRHHHPIHHDHHWTHRHDYWKHQDRLKSHRRFRE